MNRMIPKLALLLTLLMRAFGMNANPINMRTAREVAVKFMNANTETPLRGTDDLQLVTTYNISRGDAAFYVFNTPNGFVIVSADDCATPILGYSNEGQFDVNNIPIQLQDYLQDFVEQIQYGIENHLEADEQTAQQWELVRTVGRLTNNRSDEIVEPLLSTRWNQGSPYNMYVPNGYPTGCVATAMAQIMKYWEWPVQGTGEHSYQWNGQTLSANFGETIYDWENMLDSYGGQSTQEQDEAVATLMWHCGVSVNMNYSPNGSSSGQNPETLINYFNYSDDMHFENKQDDESWVSLLKTDLDFGRPIYYTGCDNSNAGCHAFVCDGYDVNDRFHFNYGWSGAGDGYYALNAIVYYDSNYALFNIHPNANITRQVTASASPSDGGVVAGAGMYDIGSICTMTAMANEGYIFMNWTEDDEVVSAQAEYSFCVRKDRDLVAHFGTPFPIEVVIDPEGSGMVSGVGEYAYGSTCILTATANEGYDFICWRRADGSVASRVLTYSFTVTEATTLTAVFAVSGGEQIAFADLNVKAICVANWDTNGDGELSYLEAASVTNLGEVFRGNTEITSFEELQYFTGLTTIGNYAFYYCRNLSGSLSIPNSVNSIGERAFVDCSGFTGNLVFPDSVTLIGDRAFWGCSGFTGNLIIGSSVTTIGEYAFYNCNGFTGNLTIPNSVISIGNFAFSGCSGCSGSLTIPNSVTTIGAGAFRDCSGFTGSLTIGNSVTTIGSHAFSGCSSLTGDLNIPNSVITIDERAFYNCSSFTGSLTIGNSVTTIGGSAFSHCRSFTGNLIIGNSVTTIGGSAFAGCSGFTGDLIIPNSVTAIGYSAFKGCSGFTGNLTIGNSVTTINGYAFSGCSGFTGSLTIPNTVTSIRNSAFSGCSGFTGDLIIPNSVTTIENFTFQSCNGFTGNLTIPNSVISIGTAAFQYCSGFTGDLVIPNSVTTIGSSAFYGCSGFTGSLTIGSSVTTIGNSAFSGCRGFTGNLTIPNTVTSIDDYTFQGCRDFTGMTIPNSVTSIGNFAFYGCNGFTGSLTIPNSVTTIGSYAFYGCNDFTGNLTIGSSVATIGEYAFGNNRNFTSMKVLPETPPTAVNAFYSGLYGIPVYVPCGSLEAYQEASGWSNFTNYQEDCLQTQIVTFAAGSNWFSANVDIGLEDLQDALVAALPGATSITIKAKTQSSRYNGSRWRGALDWDVAQMYILEVPDDCEIVLTGLPINPAEHPITIIANGANWIGFPFSESMSLDEIFSGFAVSGDVIRSKTGNARYTGTSWRASNLNGLEPGKGYIYQSNSSEDRTLIFPSGAK